MSYYTTVKVVNNKGQAVKAEVSCGGKFKGYTNPDTGCISFDMSTNDSYDVAATRPGERASGKIRGGGEITLRLG